MVKAVALGGLAVLLAGCIEPARAAPASAPGLGGPSLQAALGHIELRQLDERPRLALVSRDGDPAPAVVVTVATDLDPVPTTALAAIVEARLRAAGFDVDARVDRGAFRVRLLVDDSARLERFFAEVVSSFARPVAAGSPELTAAAAHLEALRRNPLDSAALTPVASCTGALGIAGGTPATDLAGASGAGNAEGWRTEALQVGHTSVAAVGPAAFVTATAAALKKTAGWPTGPAATDPWPAEDTAGAYVTTGLDHRGTRVTLAVRVADPLAAVAAAERLGAADSPLVSRLRALGQPWRVVEVVGAARPRGGCVSVAAETQQRFGPGGTSVEAPAAAVAALVRAEMTAELAGGGTTATATKQILAAGDPREAASRAAWWALSAPAPGAPDRWAAALGVPAGASSATDPDGQRFATELARAVAAASIPAAERRLAVERGQGELWVLLASPCGPGDEGSRDAGVTALALLGAAEAARGDVAVEPWATADGAGVVAHAAFRDDRETSADLARRVGDAAARALAATLPSAESVAATRMEALAHLERAEGPQGAAFEALAGALSPDHPSFIEPFGVWSGVAGAGVEAVRLRAQSLASGPLRVAVLANGDEAQAGVAASAVDRWLGPRQERTCRGVTVSAVRAGHFDVHLPADTVLAQALVGAPVPPLGAPGHDLAELTALALGGPEGPLAHALQPLGATSQVRLLGGSHVAALVVDLRAPEGALSSAVAEAKSVLTRLSQAGTDADLGRAAATSERESRAARTDPRRRLVDLWLGRAPAAKAKPSLEAWHAFCAATLREASFVVVEAHP